MDLPAIAIASSLSVMGLPFTITRNGAATGKLPATVADETFSTFLATCTAFLEVAWPTLAGFFTGAVSAVGRATMERVSSFCSAALACFVTEDAASCLEA